MTQSPRYSLVVDAGSTKTQWLIKELHKSTLTSGINPVHLTDLQLWEALRKGREELPDATYSSICWYGAGCGSEHECRRMQQSLQAIFGEDTDIEVGSDLLCAARATAGSSAAIVCILGTGSNSGLYDGQEIVDNIPPLGYILGDEGSGAAIGKRLVNAVLKRALSPALTERLKAEYNIYKDTVQSRVYRQPDANRYLASLTRAVVDMASEPEIENLVREELKSFITNNILRYPEAKILPVHAVGGVASTFSEIFTQELRREGLHPGVIARSPLDLM